MKRVINKNKVFYFVVAALAVVIIVVTGVKAFFDFFSNDDKPVVTKKKLDSLEMYGYTLDDLDTPLYKSYFEELKEVLDTEEVDMNAYASVLTKLFVTDFYTLSNKVTSSDIGGLEFVHKDIIDNFKLNAGDTMYNHVKNNVYGDRVQDLPTVKEVLIDNIQEEKYNYNNQDYDAFKIVATWDYENDLGYEKNGIFYLIKDNNKLNVVEKLGE